MKDQGRILLPPQSSQLAFLLPGGHVWDTLHAVNDKHVHDMFSEDTLAKVNREGSVAVVTVPG